MSLKLLINKKDDKVVFAEAKKDFIDFLFNHFLTLPIGTILTYMVVDDYSVSSRSQSDQHDDLVTYMVADDLSVTPMSMTSTMALFKKYNIQEVDVLEEKVVSIGLEEALHLLHCALHSKEALTNVFL
ncbi:hypothetical protein CK203_111544 [Vitis vinifera]|uniref:DUF674 domain-containing protein n=1 Tax=Vitis vinifera TaxID=29760 RepID=A0A438FGD9_VITVI|nr:hypothetical protein CK203_111544 [Vitis vinifera]